MIIYIFHALSIIALLGAVMVVVSKKPLYSILYLIMTFFAIAAHYILLNAQFLAVVQVIVYAGAIMVLFLFVVMLLNLNEDTDPRQSTKMKIAATLTGGLLLVLLVGGLKKTDQLIHVQTSEITAGYVSTLGKVLLTDFVLPFEVVSILFLAAMVGAVVLGRKD